MIYLLKLNCSIYDQLILEERLLRNDTRNFIIVNQSSSPAIVMGISGKLEELVNQELLQQKPIPVIRRCSGGGTVIVDEETLFVSFLFQDDFFKGQLFPEPILEHAAEFYRSAFPEITLRENDFVIGDKKCGGNALYIKKKRFLLHTSFLWNYRQDHMDYLLHPKKTPHYREGRDHSSFLCRLSDFYEGKEIWLERLEKKTVQKYGTIPMSVDELGVYKEERIATVLL